MKSEKLIKLDVYPRANEESASNRIYIDRDLDKAINEYNATLSDVNNRVELKNDDTSYDISLLYVVGKNSRIEKDLEGKYYSYFTPNENFKHLIGDISIEKIQEEWALDLKAVGCVMENNIVDLHYIINYTLRPKKEILTKSERREISINDLLKISNTKINSYTTIFN